MPVIYPNFANSPGSFSIVDVPLGVPIIGYNNIVTPNNISSFTTDTDHPVSNLATPDTFRFWKGAQAPITAGVEYIDIFPGGATVDYIAVAGHNFNGIGSQGLWIADVSVSPRIDLLSDTTYQTAADSSALIMRFKPGAYGQLRLYIEASAISDFPRAAVIYCGRLLVLERGIKVDTTHVPITMGRKTSVVNGMSETGNFLGRIVLSESRQSKAEFFGFTPTFFRASVDPFLSAAQEDPFFWAWAPVEYPNESGYAWLTNDPQPEVSPDHRRVALTLQMNGIA